MNKFTMLSVLLLLFFTFSSPFETSAQIHDIKKKSSSNKSKKSRSSSKKKKSRSSSSSSSSGSGVDASEVFGCISNIFDVAGCLFSAIENTESNSSSDYSSNDYYSDDDYVHYEPEVNTDKNDETNKTQDTNNENITPKSNETEDPKYAVENNVENESLFIDTIKKESEVTLDIRANFDLSLHKGIDKNYVHIDYLPGLRASFDFFMFDFRFNILTEYTDDFPDSFKSWELLAMFNITANQDYSVILGTGMHKEEYNEGSSFHEFYLGTKIPLKNKKDYVDIDTRFSTDYKTNEFPFFEFGGRYNVRFLDTKNLSGYITLGATYQNYYQFYDIWGFRGGIVLNIH